MLWIAPSEQDEPNAALEKRRGNTADSFCAHSGLISYEYSRGCPQGLFGGLLWLGLAALLGTSSARAADSLFLRQWTVDGVVREAIIWVPPGARTDAVPVVFAFHGHGGSMQNAARSLRIHEVWPEAMVVYMQGLRTPGQLTDPEGKEAGWQAAAGDQGDRDLKFFDAVLTGLRQDYKPDAKRLYATGHSNGGGFTYLLWAARGESFAAFVPSAAAAARSLPSLKPKPVLHVAGEKDTLVRFEWQQRTMLALRRLNQCGEGQPWEGEKGCTIYPSKLGGPVVTFIHSGAHAFPAAAPAIIAKFFKQHARPDA